MIFNYKYSGSSKVESSAASTDMNFAPDTFRDPTYFIGEIHNKIPFREAISALHDVVVSDLRWKPKDREEYKAWIATQNEVWLAEALSKQGDLKLKVDDIQSRLKRIREQKNKVLGPFYSARRDYFNYLYKKDRDAWYVLDPVISVHPDELFFECFSQDESTYGKLSCKHDVFTKINEFKCGTTNIDYSEALYNEFQKIRNYKTTKLSVDPEGFNIQTTDEDDYREVKIDLPDTWVRGFLQVSSAMSLPASFIRLTAIDLYNILFILKRYKEKKGPRAMRYVLVPGQRVKIVFEPWEMEIECSHEYTGFEPKEIRVWGRRRLLTLERLLPITRHIDVHLLGTGMPSFYIADLGDMYFTLGLSGWTTNDWSRAGNFDLMAPRASVDSLIQQKVLLGLKKNWAESSANLAKQLNLSEREVKGSLSLLIQHGKVIYDLNQKVYRFRELSNDDLPMDKLRFANDREELAHELLKKAEIKVEVNGEILSGTVTYKGKTEYTKLKIDKDERLVEATCSCNFYSQNRLKKGPCEHILATRLKFAQINNKRHSVNS